MVYFSLGPTFSSSVATPLTRHEIIAWWPAAEVPRILAQQNGEEKASHVEVLWMGMKFPEYVGVSQNRGTPKWMVYNGKPYENGWFGGTPIFGNIHVSKKRMEMKLGVVLVLEPKDEN